MHTKAAIRLHTRLPGGRKIFGVETCLSTLERLRI